MMIICFSFFSEVWNDSFQKHEYDLLKEEFEEYKSKNLSLLTVND